jgi:hypothetical protein
MVVHNGMRSSDGSNSGCHGCHGSHRGHRSHSVSHTCMAEPSHSVAQPGVAESSHSVAGDDASFRHGYGHAHESDDL